MHEMSLIHDLMRKIQTLAREQSATRVTGVTVRIGALAHISADHFREHFEEESKGTLAEGAQLEVVMMTDEGDPQAQDILLESIDVED